MYAWYKWERENSAGFIDEFFGAINPIDTSNLVADTDVVDLFLDNTGASTITQGFSGSISGYILFSRRDGVYPQVQPTSGGGGIGLYYIGTGYGATVGSGPLTPTQAAQLANASNTGTQNVSLNTTIDSNVDQLLLDVAAVPNATDNADALLGRDIQGGSSGNRTVTQALRASRNRVDMQSGIVYEEDDTTPSHSYNITRAPLDAVSEVDPT